MPTLSSSVGMTASAPSPNPSSPVGKANVIEPVSEHRNRPPMLSSLPRDLIDSDTPGRKSYLPLVSPCVDEGAGQSAGRPPKRRRLSTPTALPSTVGGYFDLQGPPKERDVEMKSKQRSDQTASVPVDESDPEHKQEPIQGDRKQERTRIPVIELPDEIAHPLFMALQSSMGKPSTRQYRAMSVPRNLRSKAHPFSSSHLLGSGSASGTSTPRERRDSMRAQQLSLLASQARLASTGTTNVHTAMRTEKAVKGAMWKAVEDVQARKARGDASAAIASADEADDAEGRQSECDSEKKAEEPSSPIKVESIQDPAAAWSQALADRKSATSFLRSARDVAHDWANGFYAFEKEWVGDALQREQKKLDEEGQGAASSLSQTENSPVFGPDLSTESVLGRRTSLSAPPAIERGDGQNELIPMTDEKREYADATEAMASSSSSVTTARLTLMEAQRRLSLAPEQVEIGGRGKLVDVLSNFATLIDSRKEGCHSLEKLAQNARRLSSVQLPTLRLDGHFPATVTGSGSAISSNASSPASLEPIS